MRFGIWRLDLCQHNSSSSRKYWSKIHAYFEWVYMCSCAGAANILAALGCLVIWLPARSFAVLAIFSIMQGVFGGTILCHCAGCYFGSRSHRCWFCPCCLLVDDGVASKLCPACCRSFDRLPTTHFEEGGPRCVPSVHRPLEWIICVECCHALRRKACNLRDFRIFKKT